MNDDMTFQCRLASSLRSGALDDEVQVLLHPVLHPLHLERLVLPLSALPALRAALVRPDQSSGPSVGFAELLENLASEAVVASK